MEIIENGIKPPIIMSAEERVYGGEEFTPDDLAAADQLVQLSVSGGDARDACSSSTALSSPRSVNNAGSVLAAAAAARDQDDDDDGNNAENDGVVDRRARKRYRLVSELYAATRQVRVKSSAAAEGGKRKRRDWDTGSG